MKKNKDFLSFFLNLETRQDLYKDLYLIFSEMIKNLKIYYEIYDYEHKTRLSPVFYDLYINEDRINYALISIKYNLDLKTLYRYRKRFNDTALMLIDNHLESQYIKEIINELDQVNS